MIYDNLTKVLRAVCIFAGFSLLACEPELPGLVRFEEQGQEETKVLALGIGRDEWPSTRSSLGDGVEGIFSGAVLAIYDAYTGLLDSEVNISAQDLGGEVKIELPAGRTYDFYLLGNLWEISSGGAKRMPAFPPMESDVSSMSYSLDGGTASGGFRRENFSETSKYGIPLFWQEKGVSADVGKIKIKMRRLFSRLTVEIDHRGLAGGTLDDFVNGTLRIRQVNCRLSPFSNGGSRAESSADVLSVGDFDVTMSNAVKGEYVYYVPENRQGVLLPTNSDPARKDRDAVVAANPGTGIADRLTFVEFEGSLGGGTGFSGKTVYRFFLGKDAVKDFDIERNLRFKVSLGFNYETLFSPDWKLEVEGLSDRREFFLSGELAGRLPDGQVAVVRKNRPAVLDLNLTLDDGANRITSTPLVDEGFEAQHIGDMAWTSNFWSATHNDANEPARKTLSELGIGVSYQSGRFTFAVENPSLFVSGRSIPVYLNLYPGDRQVRAVIKTGDNISVTASESIYDDFYIAQHRTLSFSGFEGDTIYYAADQDDCTLGSSARHSFNRQWKTDNSLSSSFPVCRVSSNGSAIYPYQNYGAYSSQRLSSDGKLDIYTFFPNDFSMIPSYQNASGSIVICSEDILNDGLTEVPIYVRAPRLHLDGIGDVKLPVDGSECSLGKKIYTKAALSAFPEGSFDPTLFEALLSPVVELASGSSSWTDCIGLDPLSGEICLKSTGPLKSGNYAGEATAGIGTLKIAANPATGLYSGSAKCSLGIGLPYLESEPSAEVSSSYLNDSGFTSSIEVPIRFCLDGGDPDRYEFSVQTSGSSLTMADGTFTPIISGEYRDGTVGTAYYWKYDEKNQPDKTRYGNFLPGGLLLPYGPQKVTFTAVNKWDGGRFSVSASFNISYKVIMEQLGVFGDTAYGTIYPLPQKSIDYIMKYWSRAGEEAADWMLKLLGTNAWLSNYRSGPDFYNAVKKQHMQPNGSIKYNKGYYSVRYLDDSATKWSEDLAKKAFYDSNYQWLDNLTIGGSSDWCSDPSLTGSEWLDMFFCTEKGGYIYTGEEDFLP